MTSTIDSRESVSAKERVNLALFGQPKQRSLIYSFDPDFARSRSDTVRTSSSGRGRRIISFAGKAAAFLAISAGLANFAVDQVMSPEVGGRSVQLDHADIPLITAVFGDDTQQVAAYLESSGAQVFWTTQAADGGKRLTAHEGYSYHVEGEDTCLIGVLGKHPEGLAQLSRSGEIVPVNGVGPDLDSAATLRRALGGGSDEVDLASLRSAVSSTHLHGLRNISLHEFAHCVDMINGITTSEEMIQHAASNAVDADRAKPYQTYLRETFADMVVALTDLQRGDAASVQDTGHLRSLMLIANTDYLHYTTPAMDQLVEDHASGRLGDLALSTTFSDLSSMSFEDKTVLARKLMDEPGYVLSFEAFKKLQVVSFRGLSDSLEVLARASFIDPDHRAPSELENLNARHFAALLAVTPDLPLAHAQGYPSLDHRSMAELYREGVSKSDTIAKVADRLDQLTPPREKPIGPRH